MGIGHRPAFRSGLAQFDEWGQECACWRVKTVLFTTLA